MALPLLERCCRGLEDVHWSVVDTTINEQVSRMVEAVVEQQPDVILGTAYLFTVTELLNACHRIKRLCPNVHIILGGPEFLGANEDFLREHPYIDAVVRGEGESVISCLLENIDHHDRWTSIPGVCYRTAEGGIRDDGRFAELLQVDQIPDPTESRFMNWEKGFVLLETSRGCPAHCSFCTSALPTGVRTFPIPRIRMTLQRVREAGVREVRILDRTFNHPPKRAIELLSCFLDEFPELWFHLEVYPNLLTKEIMDLIENAAPGRLHLEIGLQSTQATILKKVRRPDFGKTAQAAFKRLCAMPHIPIHVDLLAGLPGQSIEDIYEDLRLLSKWLPEHIQLEVLKILKGTPLANELEQHGIVHSGNPPYEVMRTDTMSFAHIREAQRLSRILDAFHGNRELCGVVREVWSRRPDFWRDFEQHLRDRIDVEAPQSLPKRYRLLHEFLLEYDLPEAQELEVQWVKQGHSPLKGLAQAELWKTELPEDCHCISHVPGHKHYRDSRTYRIHQKTRDYWLRIYRKGQKQSDVLGEWVRPVEEPNP